MQLKNDFSPKTRELFIWNKECWICGQNTWNALHHIVGRESNSALNACPVCNESCHLNKGFSFEEKKILLNKTLTYLMKNNYQLTRKDMDFLEKYRKFYK